MDNIYGVCEGSIAAVERIGKIEKTRSKYSSKLHDNVVS